MSGEKTKTMTAPEAEQGEGAKEKAKAAIVAIIDGVPSILVLTRSEQEDTRPGGDDWVGGKLEEGETPRRGLKREGDEELPGTVLKNVTELTEEPISKMKGGELVVSHLFAATAEFPSDGITLSHEHSGHGWVPFDEFADTDMPNKYKRAVASESGRLVLDKLALSLQEEPDLVGA